MNYIFGIMDKITELRINIIDYIVYNDKLKKTAWLFIFVLLIIIGVTKGKEAVFTILGYVFLMFLFRRLILSLTYVLCTFLILSGLFGARFDYVISGIIILFVVPWIYYFLFADLLT